MEGDFGRRHVEPSNFDYFVTQLIELVISSGEDLEPLSRGQIMQLARIWILGLFSVVSLLETAIAQERPDPFREQPIPSFEIPADEVPPKEPNPDKPPSSNVVQVEPRGELSEEEKERLRTLEKWDKCEAACKQLHPSYRARQECKAECAIGSLEKEEKPVRFSAANDPFFYGTVPVSDKLLPGQHDWCHRAWQETLDSHAPSQIGFCQREKAYCGKKGNQRYLDYAKSQFPYSSQRYGAENVAVLPTQCQTDVYLSFPACRGAVQISDKLFSIGSRIFRDQCDPNHNWFDGPALDR